MSPTRRVTTAAARTPRAGSRITGAPVPLCAPNDGEVYVLVMGEAPGPRGADQSGVPFFGDGAGKHLYRALERVGAVRMPAAVATLPWDGAAFRAHGLVPALHGVAVGNAFDRCPTDDGVRFRAPTRAELEGDANLARLAADVARLVPRGLRGIVTLGKVAARTVGTLARVTDLSLLRHVALPHPSAQGLLSMAPDRGRGARLADLEEAWVAQCMRAVGEAGYPITPGVVTPEDAA
ncbi:MAG: hypothetical protein LCH84_13280 [Gemmatimonadetes bacterium]|nr:hypothetical protein [Gemmatimonadota bacterium]